MAASRGMILKLPLATILLLVAILPILAIAQGDTGANRIDSDQCPPDVESVMVYSPFKPYFKFDKFKGNVQNCWVAADCLFEAAGESRKQQFAATALVMGLIPLTLKDIAWPERRLIHVTNRLNWMVEILVLALGLVPLETKNKAQTRQKSREGNMLAKFAWASKMSTIVLLIVTCALSVVASYAGLLFMEIYSKRSALGCPVPLWLPVWHIISLVPAGIHSFFAGLRRHRYNKVKRQGSVRSTHGSDYSYLPSAEHSKPLTTSDGADGGEDDNEQKLKITSAVQGADEDWPVQMAWAIYYIAGTLVYTSIMAVTVVELVIWVGLGFAVTGSSKILAFFLCVVNEETGDP
ncbi:hypothetical protein BKA66DRAFT_575012 [Pyrenochaeta sp. MPI-SDFR-AT-0127]|nr:hypothetical protein BKA66DRAFT_575012 [Pyrenochaeta sp. MPI-SDFR-AT-0127]